MTTQESGIYSKALKEALLEDDQMSQFSDDIQMTHSTPIALPNGNAENSTNPNKNKANDNNKNNNTNPTPYAPNQIHQQRKETERSFHPYKRPNNSNNLNELTQEQILRKILTQTTSISKQTNSNTINQLLREEIKKEGLKEIELALATITIKPNQDLNLEKSKKIVEDIWVKENKQLMPPMWLDKKRDLIYAQFINWEAKKNFLNKAKKNIIIKNIINGEDIEGTEHYNRRLIKIEISRVRENMNSESIIKTIKMACKSDMYITDTREGKIHNISKTKIVSFLTNAAGFEEINGKLKWKIPYQDQNKNIKANLYAKINAKPWLCKDCNTIGTHNCKGRSCGRCNSGEHLTKDCTNIEFCINCHQTGHAAKDNHCKTYLKTIARNIAQMDIPASYLVKDNKINILIDNLQLK